MTTIFNTWQGAFFNPGGGEVQLLHSKSEIERAGWTVELYNQWHPQHDFDIFHQFSLEPGVHHAVHNYHRLGKKIVISPIYWHEPEHEGIAYHYIRDLFERSNLLMTNSDAESSKLARVFDVDISQFHKVRNGVSDSYLTDGDPHKFRDHYKVEGDFLLSVANIDERKNTYRLIEACKDLNQKLILIGHVRDLNYFESFRDLSNNFIFLGPVLDVDMLKSAYRACSLFVLPSLCETPGIAALEAAAQGAKIAITSEGCTHEYFGELVTYLDPLDVDNIRDGISKELSSHRGDQLKNKVRGTFTWRHAGFDILKGYSRIIKGS